MDKDKYELEMELDTLVTLHHRVQMKHINADRMGDKYLRKEANALDEEYENKRDKFLDKWSKLPSV